MPKEQVTTENSHLSLHRQLTLYTIFYTWNHFNSWQKDLGLVTSMHSIQSPPLHSILLHPIPDTPQSVTFTSTIESHSILSINVIQNKEVSHYKQLSQLESWLTLSTIIRFAVCPETNQNLIFNLTEQNILVVSELWSDTTNKASVDL